LGHPERFIDRVLAGDRFLEHTSTLNRHHYLERATAGGYPEVLGRPEGRRRSRWLDNYVQRIVERDARDVSNLQRLGELPLILRVLAARNGAELNLADIARETEIPVRTLTPYVELLETLYLIQRVPAWSTNLTKRAVSRPKVSLLDTGLAARLINVSARGAAPEVNGDLAGALLEGFVAGELRRQLGWSDELVRISHFRDQAVGEVDLVLETPDGRVVGIEVKAKAAPTGKDVRGLTQLRDTLGRRFVAGIVLHTGATSGSFGDRISAVPLDVLWTT
jgi:predicted AAA+ superfamily ATPase